VQVTSNGQVTIPQEIRNRLGLLPHTKVAFELAGDHARIRKAGREAGASTRGRLALDALRSTADVRLNTDQIMALTRGEADLEGRAIETGHSQLAGAREAVPRRARGQQRPIGHRHERSELERLVRRGARRVR